MFGSCYPLSHQLKGEYEDVTLHSVARTPWLGPGSRPLPAPGLRGWLGQPARGAVTQGGLAQSGSPTQDAVQMGAGPLKPQPEGAERIARIEVSALPCIFSPVG